MIPGAGLIPGPSVIPGAGGILATGAIPGAGGMYMQQVSVILSYMYNTERT